MIKVKSAADLAVLGFIGLVLAQPGVAPIIPEVNTQRPAGATRSLSFEVNQGLTMRVQKVNKA